MLAEETANGKQGGTSLMITCKSLHGRPAMADKAKAHWLWRLTALLALFSLTVSAHAALLSVNLFGDSLSDSGNLFALTAGEIPPSPPYAGRASNGPVWIEQLASSHGALPPNNVFATGMLTSQIDNFAVVGAYTGSFPYPPPAGPLSSSNTSDRFLPGQPVTGLPGLQEQVGLYATLLSLGPGAADPSAVNVVWAGANDLVFAGFNNSTAQALAAPAVANVQTAIEGLIGLGGEKFVVMNLPDIGRTPFGVSQSDGGTDLSLGSMEFNSGLEKMVADLTAAYAGVEIELIDIYSLFTDLLDSAAADPAATGFPDASVLPFMPPGLSFCLNQDTFEYFCETADPNDRIFFDVVHPSSRTHGIVAAAVESALVPIPATIFLLALGLWGFGWVQKCNQGRRLCP